LIGPSVRVEYGHPTKKKTTVTLFGEINTGTVGIISTDTDKLFDALAKET
jgi:hypothetical protein